MAALQDDGHHWVLGGQATAALLFFLVTVALSCTCRCTVSQYLHHRNVRTGNEVEAVVDLALSAGSIVLMTSYSVRCYSNHRTLLNEIKDSKYTLM